MLDLLSAAPARASTLLLRLGIGATGAVCGLLLALGPSHGGLPTPDAIARLNGRWAGQGHVVLQRGPNESFKCVVTYLPAGDGARVRQNLRCSNESTKLDASTHLQFAGTSVSGRWEDNVHNLDGTISGTLTADGFDIELAGRFFHATMVVTGDACVQSVKVSPLRGGDNIREISAALRKC